MPENVGYITRVTADDCYKGLREITTPENVGYITRVTADDCYKGLSHNALRPTRVDLVVSCFLLDMNVLKCYCASW